MMYNPNPYPFGTYQAPQGRFVQPQANYPLQVPIAQTAPQAPGMALRPVTSVQEASACQIPFDGTTSWFYDTSGDKLYSKTFDFSTGTAPIVTYIREQPAPVIQYATAEALESALQDIQNLRDEIQLLRGDKEAKT